jgi:hypothetical protein
LNIIIFKILFIYFFNRSAFWGLMLPKSIPERIGDIWRSYMTQRLLWKIGSVAFISTNIARHRKLDLNNEKEKNQDIAQEAQVLNRLGVLVNTLSSWVDSEQVNIYIIIYLFIVYFFKNSSFFFIKLKLLFINQSN